MRLKEFGVNRKTPCPDEQALVAYAHGAISDAAREACEQHVVDCERCSSAVEWLRQHQQRCSPEGSSGGSSPSGDEFVSADRSPGDGVDTTAGIKNPSPSDQLNIRDGFRADDADGSTVIRGSHPLSDEESRRLAADLAELKKYLASENGNPSADHGNETGADPDSIGRLGKYEVLGVIGKGAFGTVFKAYDEQLRRMVALKLLKRSVAEHASSRRRFIREARAVAAINHSNVVTIYAVEEIDGLPLLVMELVSGRTLRERIKMSPRLTPTEITRIAAQIAAGLAAAHAQGVVHRDVKPSNVLLENGVERVKLTDFGLATCSVDNVELTSGNIAVGTPAYMSPEQAMGQPTDARSDLFGLGCVLYAMVTGDSPFAAKTTLETSQRVVNWEPKRLHEVRSDIPRSLSVITERLLHKDPAQRYATAAEVANVLNECVSELHLHDASHRDLQTIATKPAGSLRSANVLVIVLVVLLAIPLLMFLRKGNTAKRDATEDRTEKSINSGDASTGGEQDNDAIPPAAFRATLDLSVWGLDQPQRQGRSIREQGVLPIGPRDSLRLDVQLQPAMHLYVIWIDALGELYPVFPWQPGTWEEWSDKQGPVDSISLPEKLDTAWPNQGASGMETIVLLADARPLVVGNDATGVKRSEATGDTDNQPAAEEFDLRTILAAIPKVPTDEKRMFFEFDERGSVRLGQERSPQFTQPQSLADHIQQTRQFIVERLATRFSLVRIIRFANQGPTASPQAPGGE